MRKQSGMALVIVIWIISLMTIMAASFALTMRRETSVVSAVKDNATALATAETGVAIAQLMLLKTEPDKRWHTDGSIYPLRYNNAEIRVRLFSPQGKIDINKADETLLTTLIGATSAEPDQQQALVSAIIDWRDPDDLVHINGAEKKQYEDAGLTYQPANKDFQLIDELQMVLGMNATLYQEIQPLITVYSGQPQVDLKLASKEVLQVVGNLDPNALNDLLQQRKEANQTPAPGPLQAIASSNTLNQAAIGNEVYTVISEARVLDDITGSLKVTFKKSTQGNTDQAFQILDWRKIDPKPSLFSDEMQQQLITPQNESE